MVGIPSFKRQRDACEVLSIERDEKGTLSEAVILVA